MKTPTLTLPLDALLKSLVESRDDFRERANSHPCDSDYWHGVSTGVEHAMDILNGFILRAAEEQS